jgi:hypothetical protein
VTHREAIRQAKAEVDRLERELKAAHDVYWQAVTDAATSGASFRDLGEEIGVAPATVMRHIGHKGTTPRPSVLDAGPPRRRRSTTATGRST